MCAPSPVEIYYSFVYYSIAGSPSTDDMRLFSKRRVRFAELACAGTAADDAAIREAGVVIVSGSRASE